MKTKVTLNIDDYLSEDEKKELCAEYVRETLHGDKPPSSEKALREIDCGLRLSRALLAHEAQKAESPKPAEDARKDALDLAQLIEGIVMGTAYSDPETAPSFEARIKEAADKIITHDARLLDEAAERAVKWTHDTQYTEDYKGDPCDPAVLIDDDALSAAVRGENDIIKIIEGKGE